MKRQIITVILLAFFCFVIMLTTGASSISSRDIIKLDTGYIKGETKDGIYRYLGIPYAAPPVRDLRWKPPQPVKPWEGILT